MNPAVEIVHLSEGVVVSLHPDGRVSWEPAGWGRAAVTAEAKRSWELLETRRGRIRRVLDRLAAAEEEPGNGPGE